MAWYGGFLVDCKDPNTNLPTIRFVNDAGVATIVAGSLTPPTGLGDGGPATRANLAPGGATWVNTLASRGPGEFFLGEEYGSNTTSARVRRVSTTSPSASGDGYYAPDGDVIYDFDLTGRHRSTKSALRGTPLSTFGYDAVTGYLTSITDRDGLVTQIARSGSTITITAPFGQQTKLALDANGYLSSVTAPNTTEVTRTTHASSGLMTDFWDAKSNHHTFAYDTDGRLTVRPQPFQGRGRVGPSDPHPTLSHPNRDRRRSALSIAERLGHSAVHAPGNGVRAVR